jgi:predicted RNase H-like nuclease (RuvC/YqgF family)
MLNIRGERKMKKVFLAAVIVLGLALAVAIVYCVAITKDRDTLNTELISVQSVLVSTQAELVTTNGTLAATLTELSATKGTLTSTFSELSTTKDTLNSSQSKLDTANQTLTLKLAELSSANNKITSIEESLTTLEDSLSNSQHELDIAEETLDGLGIAVFTSDVCLDVELVDNPQARNPTWKELMSFLVNDQTDKNTYIENVYDCSQFSRDLHNNAEAAGIQSAEVQVRFKDERVGHALNAFITTDYGLVYVDCTTEPDTIARIKLDKEFRAVDTDWVAGKNARNDSWWDSLVSYYYMESSTGGNSVISDITIYW